MLAGGVHMRVSAQHSRITFAVSSTPPINSNSSSIASALDSGILCEFIAWIAFGIIATFARLDFGTPEKDVANLRS